MTGTPSPDAPWTGDACSLVDAFRAGERSPVEELDATIAAIESSRLNAFAYLHLDEARDKAKNADITKPFGGVPTGIKELEPVEGWPYTEASLVFKDRIATRTSTATARLFERGGVVPVGQTTASEFGGLNVSVTRINGVTHNPWRYGCTVGGSSSGSAAAVAGGLVSLASGGDGGGSIRIPAGYTGLLGMKGTFGRVPRSPNAYMRPHTVVLGNLSRSVRDAARFFDVVGGPDGADPTTLPKHASFEAGLGTHELKGRRFAVVPALGGVTLDPGVEAQLRSDAAELAKFTGMVQVDIDLSPPNVAAQWMVGNIATLLADVGDLWPACAKDMTPEIATGFMLSQCLYNLHTAAEAEKQRVQLNEAMAAAFDEVDFVICATNPGPAFGAEQTTSSKGSGIGDRLMGNQAARYAMRGVLKLTQLASVVAPGIPNWLLDKAEQVDPDLVTMGALTMISNIYGNPAVSIPGATIEGLPVGMQVLGRHHEDELLFDIALAVERERPWPMVAPGVATAAAAV